MAVDIDEVTADISDKSHDCCYDDGTFEEDGVRCKTGTLTLSAELDDIPIWGVTAEFHVFDNAVLEADIKIKAGVTLACNFEVSGSGGRYWHDCDNVDCLYGEVDAGFTFDLALELEMTWCTRTWWQEEYHCGSITFTPAEVSVSISGNVRYNQCGDCDGLHGDACLNEITFSSKAKAGGYVGLNYSVPIYSGDC